MITDLKHLIFDYAIANIFRTTGMEKVFLSFDGIQNNKCCISVAIVNENNVSECFQKQIELWQWN